MSITQHKVVGLYILCCMSESVNNIKFYTVLLFTRFTRFIRSFARNGRVQALVSFPLEAGGLLELWESGS